LRVFEVEVVLAGLDLLVEHFQTAQQHEGRTHACVKITFLLLPEEEITLLGALCVCVCGCVRPEKDIIGVFQVNFGCCCCCLMMLLLMSKEREMYRFDFEVNQLRGSDILRQSTHTHART